MNQFETLATKYNILKGKDLFFSKDGLSVGFYIEDGLYNIKLATELSDRIKLIQIHYENDHASYFQEERDLWRNNDFKLLQVSEEETVTSIEKILINVFINHNEYRTKAENKWILNQVSKRHFFSLGAILDTAYDPHKSDRVFDPHKRLKKESFKIYEVNHVYDVLNKKQDWWNTHETNFFLIKYDNNYVSDSYINQFIPIGVNKPPSGSIPFGGGEKIEIIFREDLTKVFQNKYDKNEHYRYFLNPIAIEVTNNYKEQISNIISQDKNDIYQAQNIAWNYRKLSPTMNELVDLLFYLIETGIQANYGNSEVKESGNFVIYYLHKCYEHSLNIISENALHNDFEGRIEKLINDAQKLDEWLYSSFSKIFLKVYFR